MIIEYTRYQIPENQSKSFEEAYKIACTFLKQSSFCKGYELSHCKEDSTLYTLRIQWESEEAHMKGFRQSKEFMGFFEPIKAFFPMIQEMNHYDIITSA